MSECAAQAADKAAAVGDHSAVHLLALVGVVALYLVVGVIGAVLIAAVAELSVGIEAAIRASTDDPLDRVDAVVRAVFRLAVRRPALLGLVREVSRLSSPSGDRLLGVMTPLVERAVAYLQREMDLGRLRRGDARLVASLCYATVTGIATEPEALRAVGWQPTVAELRRLRTELLAFLRAALRP